MSGRDEFVEKLKNQLDQLNQLVDELESKAGELSGQAREKVDAQISQLQEMAKPARDKLRELKAVGEGRWAQMVSEAEKVHKAFVHSFNYFKSQLK
jgi:ElaB/YqjD/DUF883 family membrane-anchored ribosome-binding protein